MNFRNRLSRLVESFIIVLLLLLTVGCGNSGDALSDQPASFMITGPGVRSGRAEIEVGQTLQFTPADVIYTSSNPEAATITSAGLLTGKTASLQTTITAVDSSGVRSSNEIIVEVIGPRTPDGVLVKVSPPKLELGHSGEARLQALYTDGIGRLEEIRDVTGRVTNWTSSNPSALLVSPGGEFQGAIGASASLSEISATVSDPVLLSSPVQGLTQPVSVISPRGAALSAVEIVKAGSPAGDLVTLLVSTPKTATISLAALPGNRVAPNVFDARATFNDFTTENNFSLELTWKSSDPSVVEFVGGDQIAFLKVGTATVTAERLSQPGGSLITDSVELTITP